MQGRPFRRTVTNMPNDINGSDGVFAGSVASELGVGVQTLHYYEREGLLPPTKRTKSGYRLYTPETVERVRFVRKAQALGLKLDEIRELLRLADEGGCPCGHVERALAEKLREVDERLRELKSFRDDLAALVRRAPRLRRRSSRAKVCPIVEDATAPTNTELTASPLARRHRSG